MGSPENIAPAKIKQQDLVSLANLILRDPEGGPMWISSQLETGPDGAIRFTVTNPETGRRLGVYLGLTELRPEKVGG